MAGHEEIDIVFTSGNDTEGVEIGADLANKIWPNTSNGQRVSTLRDNMILALTILYIIETGETLTQAQNAVQNGTTQQH